MTIFIADLIFGRRHGRPRSRPSPAARLLARLRPDAAARPPSEAVQQAAAGPQLDTGPALTRRAAKEGRPALRP
jgi:hypothetical protein